MLDEYYNKTKGSAPKAYCRKIRLDLMSCCCFFDDIDKHFWEVDHLGKRFEFGGDCLGNIPSFLESRAERVDIDFRKDGFEGWCSIEREIHVARGMRPATCWGPAHSGPVLPHLTVRKCTR